MLSIIKFKPLSGAHDEGPPSYLLTIDSFTFLLDCGLDPNIDNEPSNIYNKSSIKNVDAVLLSHPDTLHLGALPYLVGKCGLDCPIYATVPIFKMGQMFMYDLHQSRHNYENFNLFTLDDVDAAFDKIIQLKYNETVPLKGGQGISITPLPAGHMIGGTIWRIVKDGEEDIIYAVDYNHKRERHLNGCFLEHISRPSLLVTDAYNAKYSQARRKERDEQLMTNILATLRDGGNVLIAVDTAGRVLELAHMLDQLWHTPDAGLMAYSLALLNTISYNVIEFAKSQVEWMSNKIMKSFEGQRNNPFQFRHLQLCHNLKELQQRVREPRVVLASQPDLESGFARELFVQWCTNPRNSIILTQRSPPGTLAHQLMNSSQKLITLIIKQRIPLEGLELEEYKREKQQKQLLNAKKDVSDSDTDSDSDDDILPKSVHGPGVAAGTGSSYNSVAAGHGTVVAPGNDVYEGLGYSKYDLVMPVGSGKIKVGGLFKQGKNPFPMFPAPEHKIKWDDYGAFSNHKLFPVSENSTAAESGQGSKFEENKENKKGDDENSLHPASASDQQEIPTKCITNVQTFYVNANIQFIDFEGRSDKDSLKKIISLIKPRRLVLIHGSSEATQELASYCSSSLPTNKIFTPRVGEIVDATTESHIYQVKLKDSLVSTLNFVKAKDGTELAWVDADIEMSEERSLLPQDSISGQNEDELMDDLKADKLLSLKGDSIHDEMNGDNPSTSAFSSSSSRETLPILKPLALKLVQPHENIFVNELKLSDFKQVLMNNGIQAEFHGGVLHCNNLVTIKRNESGRILIEGTLSNDYFQVRELLYQQYSII
ncbi:cleavage and polyadenylation specificity factor subunit 2 [Tetranychus urticae]|uniref:Cleavage and polyadenylation specificity factor subunit 2 n=1 Tax=Tetranychus urticae TaxID=32264 RepID=T1K3D3_TETUR|nr:cleavage and polyadenylation specificity factor subunit 2 [Tetranychus urticae]